MGLCDEYIERMKEGRDDDLPVEWALYKVVYKDEVKLCHCGEPAVWLAEIYPDDEEGKIVEYWWCNDCI